MKSNPPCCLLLQNFSCISSLINLGDTTGLGFVVIIVICLFISSKHMGDQKHASQLFPSNKSVSYSHRSRPTFPQSESGVQHSGGALLAPSHGLRDAAGADALQCPAR